MEKMVMKKSQFAKEQVTYALHQAEGALPLMKSAVA
jgi:hypothetical protein